MFRLEQSLNDANMRNEEKQKQRFTVLHSHVRIITQCLEFGKAWTVCHETKKVSDPEFSYVELWKTQFILVLFLNYSKTILMDVGKIWW